VLQLTPNLNCAPEFESFSPWLRVSPSPYLCISAPWRLCVRSPLSHHSKSHPQVSKSLHQFVIFGGAFGRVGARLPLQPSPFLHSRTWQGRFLKVLPESAGRLTKLRSLIPAKWRLLPVNATPVQGSPDQPKNHPFAPSQNRGSVICRLWQDRRFVEPHLDSGIPAGFGHTLDPGVHMAEMRDEK
jgi:hypothetical protein